MTKALLGAAASWLICAILPLRCAAAAGTFRDAPVGYLPTATVTELLRQTLSPQGRFVILANGMVRLFDNPEKIEAAAHALQEARNAPAMISVAITVNAGTHRVTREVLPQEPVVDYEVAVPRIYGAPRILPQPGGKVVIVPGTPREFTTRRAEPGTILNLAPTGYATVNPEVRMSETGLAGGITRKLTATAAAGKSMIVAVCGSVAAPTALYDCALNLGAIPANEPEWKAAATELVITPELLETGAALQITPQVVVYTVDRQQAPRRVLLRTLTTSIGVEKGKPATTSDIDPDFYALFLGAPRPQQKTEASLTVAVGVQYLGAPAK